MLNRRDASRIGIGLGLVLVGIVLRAVSNLTLANVSSCGLTTLSPNCFFNLIIEACGPASTVFFIVGGAFIALINPLIQAYSYIFNRLFQIFVKTPEYYRAAITAKNFQQEDHVQFISRHFKWFNGIADENGRDFGNFIAEWYRDFHDIHKGFWRKNYDSNISLRRPEDVGGIYAALDSSKFFVWSESLSYELTGFGSDSTYPYLSGSTVDVLDEDLDTFISYWGYKVMQGGNIIFDFQSHREKIDVEELRKNGFLEFDDFSVAYENGNLEVEFISSICVEDGSSRIAIDETSPIYKKEQDYNLSFLQPTKGAIMRIEVPNGMSFISCNVGMRCYCPNEEGCVDVDTSAPNRRVVRTARWIFPGLFGAFAWRE
ncbi:MAG: hypothetical protein ACE363_02890 [Alphaproteobacteria bacterium]